MEEQLKVAIIGAGMSGLTLAQGLSGRAQIEVFDKSRGIGGRMSTRRSEAYRFDHGAQYFTAKGPDFQAFLAPFLRDGIVEEWRPRLVTLGSPSVTPSVWTAPRYTAVPAMNSLCKAMSDPVKITMQAEVSSIERAGDGWELVGKAGEDFGRFDWVVSSVPCVQAARIMPPTFSGQEVLAATKMQGCYSLMLGFDQPLDLDWDAARVSEGPLTWIAVNSSKPGRTHPLNIICQTSNEWAEDHLEGDQEAVKSELLAAFALATGMDPAQAGYVSLHRWRYANVATPAGIPYLIDHERKLAACGDWTGKGKVETAFDSGFALSRVLGDMLT
ncbi:MAG: NAD(P)-binding protein [Paracoccaceae bacterium]|nr:NAD(P)-binding protein [Paracoccaceae bacterium]